MPWYAATAIEYMAFQDGRQTKYPVKEKVYLVKAPSLRSARRRALRFAREVFAGTITYPHGRQAKWCFAGIRSVGECIDPSGIGARRDARPKDGTEIAFSQFSVSTKKDLMKFVAGVPVEVLYMAQGLWM